MWGLVLLAGGILPGCPQPAKVDSVRMLIDAKTVLRAAAEDPQDALARRAAMQAIGEVDSEESGGVLKGALDDRDEGVRFAAAMSIGDVRYAPALPVLKEKAKVYTGERDKRTYCAVLYALYRLSDESQLGDLAAMLFDRDADVRAVAAQVMGKIGNPSAVDLLKRALTDETSDRPKYNMTEALAILGDSGAQVKLEAYATGYFMDLQLEAIPALAMEYSPSTMQILRDLMGERFSPRVRVRAAGAMARLGQGTASGYQLCVDAIKTPSKFATVTPGSDRMAASIEVASLQQLAALSLGWMRNTQALSVLGPLLQSSDGSVRVAAAESVIRLLSPARPMVFAAPARTASTEPHDLVRPPALKTSGAKD
jgi:HEAT repeat protein